MIWPRRIIAYYNPNISRPSSFPPLVVSGFWVYFRRQVGISLTLPPVSRKSFLQFFRFCRRLLNLAEVDSRNIFFRYRNSFALCFLFLVGGFQPCRPSSRAFIYPSFSSMAFAAQVFHRHGFTAKKMSTDRRSVRTFSSGGCLPFLDLDHDLDLDFAKPK